MKVYIGNVDWADEGDIFFFSVESEENLKAMKDLIDILVELDLFYSSEMYWGTNEYFDFGADDFLEFINEARDISKEELATLNKFKISGFDIYDRMIETKDKTIMFPIDMNDKDDVGTTTFEAEYKPITLMRYIRKAIEKDTLIIMNK